MAMKSVIEQLSRLRRRIRVLSLLYGLGRLAAVSAGLLVLLVAVDYLLDLPPSMRIALMAAVLAVWLWQLFRWVLAPGMARLSLDELAGRMETAFPLFQDRLRSTINFLGHDSDDSAAMRQKVMEQATQLAAQVKLSRAVRSGPAWNLLGVGAGCIIVLLGLGAWVHHARPGYLDIAFSRLLTPLHGMPWPRNVRIEMVGDVPQLMAAGEPIPLKMRLTRGDSPARQAIVHFQYGDGAERMEQMPRGADGVYSASLDARGAGQLMSFWIEAGDDRTPRRSIKVVPPLSIQSVRAIITPPPYTQAPAVTTDLSAAPASAVAGSQVQLDVRFSQDCDVHKEPILTAVSGAASVAVTAQWKWINARAAVGILPARQSLRFHIHATDQYGFGNSALEEYELLVRPDALATVQIETPQHSLDATPDALIPLIGAADDDFGIQSVTLMVNRAGDHPYHWQIPLVRQAQAADGATFTPRPGTPDRRRYRIQGVWHLAGMTLSAAASPTQLQPGDTLEFYLQAQDNFLLAGAPAAEDQIAAPDHPGMVAHRPVQSGKLRLSIVSPQEMLNHVLDEFRSLAQRIQSVHDSQQRTRLETADLAKRTANQPTLTAQNTEALRRLMNQQTSAASEAARLGDQARQLRDKLGQNHLDQSSPDLPRMAEDVQRLLEQAAQQSMKDAADKLNEAAQAPDAKQRDLALARTQQRQSAAGNELQRALDRLKDVGTLEQSMEAISRLLRQQKELSKALAELGGRNLGKTPAQMDAADLKQLLKLSDQQANLARQSDQAISKMGQTAEQLSKSDPASASAMKNAAETARQQQVVPSQRQAAQAARQNQQSDAQTAQNQAELGLQMILGNLQEAQKHKLEELAKHLADLRQQVEHLARRQAGHNLDNLSLQGETALQKAGEKVVAALRQEAHRPAPAASPPTLDQLAASQTLTQRNTRDIAQSADSAKGDDVQTIQLLIRAAGQMEQAAAALGDHQAAAAYDPAQVQALATLNDALRQIAQRQAELADKLARGRQDSLRRKYEQIRDDQTKLNEQVVSVDHAPRAQGGQFNRGDLIRLNQLSAAQQALAQRVGKLEDDLTAMNSIVYLWTNQDIARLMDQSRKDLDKPQTGRPTQLQQHQIVAMLDDVIKSLAIEPRLSEFEQRQSGGGGAGGGQSSGQARQLPSETELRLLKSLQQGVNAQTASADDADPRNTAELKQIGGRQGDLRGLLDTLLSKASDGKVTLGPEPANKNILPEETAQGAGQDLEQQLLQGKPSDDPQMDVIHRLGQRMARSDQRLALDQDAGRITQIIQQNIIKGLDQLIEQSRQQMAKNSSSSQQNSSQAQNQPNPNQKPGSPDNQPAGGAQASKAGATAAQSSSIGAGNGQSGAQLGPDIRQKLTEWGGISPRMRAAVIDSAGETVIQKYQKLVDDYYRSLATQEQ